VVVVDHPNQPQLQSFTFIHIELVHILVVLVDGEVNLLTLCRIVTDSFQMTLSTLIRDF
jgi:hypothetical protein